MKKRPAASPPEADPDLLLNEDSLIRLAMRELNGRLPPGYQPASRALGFARRGADSDADDEGFEADAFRPRQGTGSEGGLLAASHKPRTVLAHELDLRGWTIRDLADTLGVPSSEVLALVKGHSRVTPELAQKLARAFATSVEFWL